jgi:hypothetical protein
MKKIVITASFSFLFVVGIVAMMFVISGAGGSSKDTVSLSTKAPVNLSGSWHQSSNDAPVTMTAEIDGDHIQILMSSDLANGILYWDGTFDTHQNTADSFKVVSTADEKALSTATIKTFTYSNDELSYDFTMLGKDYTIHMARGE